MSNLALIQPQRVDFDTCQTCDWLDGLPALGAPGPGGSRPGDLNVGKGALTIASVGPGTPLGAHVVAVAAVAGGQTYLSVAGPDEAVTGRGVAGLPLAAGGLTLTLAQFAGQAALAVGDTFAVSVVPSPIDLTGLVFTLDARQSVGAATIALQASSAPADGSDPTLLNGGAAGTLAVRLLKAAMARALPGAYPYQILATDPVTGLSVPAFYGVIHHVAVAALLGQGT